MNKTASLIVGVTIIGSLLLVIGFLGVYRDLQASNQRLTKIDSQLQKTEDKLDYYEWRESTSTGHSVGPSAYPGPGR